MKRLLIPLLFVGALALAPNSAQARGYSRFDFSFGFSSGYYNRGYGSFHYGYSRPYFYHSYYYPIYRSRYFYYDPVYIAPPPVVYFEPAPIVRRYYYRDYCAPRTYYRERTYYYER